MYKTSRVVLVRDNRPHTELNQSLLGYLPHLKSVLAVVGLYFKLTNRSIYSPLVMKSNTTILPSIIYQG